jgi:1-acyl-sn-glycerol-3-phosphate acyltransferase
MPGGTLHSFKKGPFVIAIEGGVPIVPVGLVGSWAIMPRGSFWIRWGAIVVRVGEPISLVGMGHADRDRLRDRVRDAVARLQGGEERTCCLPGEPPLDDVSEPLRSNSNPA